MIWSIPILIGWIFAAYKLNDWLVYQNNVKSGSVWAIAFMVAGLYFVAWLNGVPLFENDGCYGAANSATC